jgi:hypothetical protein
LAARLTRGRAPSYCYFVLKVNSLAPSGEDALASFGAACREYEAIGKSLPLMALVAHEAGASIRQVARAGGIPTSRAYNLIRHGQDVSRGALLAGATPTTEPKEVTMTTALQAPTLSLLDSGLRLVAFKINRTFWEGMSDEELYERTRFAWRTNPHLHDPDLAFAVVHGIVRAVYRIDRWEPTPDNRWMFHGELDEDLTQEWGGVDVSADMGRATNPVRYINC